MRGHLKLIEMRKQRMKPGIVFVNDWPCQTNWHEYPEDAVTISTAGDAIQTLDLRFVVGLTVTISSGNEVRAKALFEKCKAAGAEVVAGCHVLDGVPPEKRTGWFQVYRKNAGRVHG